MPQALAPLAPLERAPAPSATKPKMPDLPARSRLAKTARRGLDAVAIGTLAPAVASVLLVTGCNSVGSGAPIQADESVDAGEVWNDDAPTPPPPVNNNAVSYGDPTPYQPTIIVDDVPTPVDVDASGADDTPVIPDDPIVTIDAPEPAPLHETEQTRERSENEQVLATKVSALVNGRFAGDWRAAFDHYAGNRSIDHNELRRLLSHAGVGNMATRGSWADGVIEHLDGSRNGQIEWSEFLTVHPGAANSQ